jgi:hypothetical protein
MRKVEGALLMYRKKAIRAACFPLAGVLVFSQVHEAVAVDNPHVEPMQHEEEPHTTFDSPYSTTSAVVFNFPWISDALESISVPVLPHLKK